MERPYGEILLVGGERLIATAHVEYVFLHILLHRIPRASAETKAVALADGVEPQSLVTAQAFACFQLHHVARLLTEVSAYVFVVVYFAEEADALRVFAPRIDEMLALGNGPHLALHVVAYGEQSLAQLPVVYLGEEVGLVLHRVGTCGEPLAPVYHLSAGIVACGNEVVVVAALLVERPKLYQSVAHHVGVGRQSGAHLVHGVARHLLPILLVAVNNLQFASVAQGHGGGHLKVLLRRAVPLGLFLRPYLYVEAVGV